MSHPSPRGAGGSTTTIVLMGVTGAGKSTVMAALADRLGWATAEGDDFHPAANIRKMAGGTPLEDADRTPWLRAIAAWIGEREAGHDDALVACSALGRRHRDLLRAGHPSILFVHLQVDPGALRARLVARTDHFMPPALLASQLTALEPLEPDEAGLAIRSAGAPSTVASAIIRELGIDNSGGHAVGPAEG